MSRPFRPGRESWCRECEFLTAADPACLIAIDMADQGERMSAACCPQAAADDDTGSCPVCGSPGGGCDSCREDLRCAS